MSAQHATLATSAALLAAAALAWGAMSAAYWSFTVDDAFILLRYADHVARGIGPTWNPGGPPVEGYTSPLWVVVLAIGRALGATSELAPKALGVLFMALAIVLVARLAWRLAAPLGGALPWLAAGASAFVVGAWPGTAIHAVSGMETALATCLVTAFSLALARALDAPAGEHARRFAIAALVGLAAGLARPELNLFVALAWLVALARTPHRVPALRAVLALHALPGALYFAWRASHYGFWLPLPFYVKATLPGTTFAGAGEALAFARALLVQRPEIGVAFALGVVWKRRELAPLLVAALGVWLFFFVPAHQMGFDFRYLHPLVPVLAVAAGLGVARAAASLGTLAPPALALVLGAVALAHAVRHLPPSLAEKRDYGVGVERAHAVIGRTLRAIREDVERPVLAALDVGAIAYFSGWAVIDTWGLNEPRVARTGRRDAEPVLDERPSVVIVISSRPDRFAPHFEHEQALWDGAHARGMTQVARFEFLPDYHLLALAEPGTAAALALASAAPP